MTTTDIRTRYGATETNSLGTPHAYHDTDRDTITLKDLAAAGGRITRVRILSEYMPMVGRLADVSYIHGETADGTPVNVTPDLPVPMRQDRISAEMVRWAKAEGVYAKGLGLLDRANWSVLR